LLPGLAAVAACSGERGRLTAFATGFITVFAGISSDFDSVASGIADEGNTVARTTFSGMGGVSSATLHSSHTPTHDNRGDPLKTAPFVWPTPGLGEERDAVRFRSFAEKHASNQTYAEGTAGKGALNATNLQQ
jgi:hypothetical protein